MISHTAISHIRKCYQEFVQRTNRAEHGVVVNVCNWQILLQNYFEGPQSFELANDWKIDMN